MGERKEKEERGKPSGGPQSSRRGELGTARVLSLGRKKLQAQKQEKGRKQSEQDGWGGAKSLGKGRHPSLKTEYGKGACMAQKREEVLK